MRDADQWFDSTQATVFSDQMLNRQFDSAMKAFFAKVVTPEFGEHIHDRDFMVAQFERHTQEVMAAIPAPRLLVYDVREGWEPLCAWLGVPVPETPFPHTNTREEMTQMRQAMAEGAWDAEKISQMARERFGRA